MAHNPFDDFATDFHGTLPGQQVPSNAGGNPAPPDALPTTMPAGGMGAQQQVFQTPQYSGHQASNSNIASPTYPAGVIPVAHQQQQAAVIGTTNYNAGMYYPQPSRSLQQSSQLTQPNQSQSSALVPSASSAANPYASMLGPASSESMQKSSSLGQNTTAPQTNSAADNPFQNMSTAAAAPSSVHIAADLNNPFGSPPISGGHQAHAPTQAPASIHDPMLSEGVSTLGNANYGYGPQPPSATSGQFDPMTGAPPAPPGPLAPVAVDPFGAPPPAVGATGAIVPASQPADDPFGVFASPAAPQPAPAPGLASTSAPPPPEDPWADMGFGPPVLDTNGQGNANGAATAPSGPTLNNQSETVSGNKTLSRSPGELPPGGEWYDARIFTPTLGVMFFKPQELTDSLFLQTDKALVDALDDRPVVAFIVEGSSARSAGVELGHVLLKVNGIDVRNPKEASRLIKEGPRPLPLLFYVPDTTVVVAEGEHMVKYDTRETGAPNSAKDWKPKYVVIGGIIAQPWMMNMYRSKSEYDIAVIETQARRPVSVKVKQFSLQGARIQNDWQGPQMVKYKNKLHPWKYIVVLPVSRNPIKISSPNLSQLKPVHEGIRRVLMAQQRDRGHPSPHTAAPVRQVDPYSSRNNHGY